MGKKGGGTDELFGTDSLAELATILGIKSDDPRLPAFGDALKKYGTKRRNDIRSMPIGFPIAPFDASLTKRIEWLTTQVINPAEKLLDALSDNSRPYFHEWPDEYRLSERPDLDRIAPHIAELLGHGRALRDNLDGQRNDKIAHTSEMRYDIVATLVDIAREHFPEVKLARGQLYPEVGQMVGTTPEYVRRAFFEITGTNEQLDEPIRHAVPKKSKSQKKPG